MPYPCCCCKCEAHPLGPIGVLLQLQDGPSISIPFISGVTTYMGSATVDGYSWLQDLRVLFSDKSNGYTTCIYDEKRCRSIVRKFVNWRYRRALERVQINYNFTLNPTTCQMSGTFNANSTMKVWTNSDLYNTEIDESAVGFVIGSGPPFYGCFQGGSFGIASRVESFESCNHLLTKDPVEFVVGDTCGPYTVSGVSNNLTYPDSPTYTPTATADRNMGFANLFVSNKGYCDETANCSVISSGQNLLSGWLRIDPFLCQPDTYLAPAINRNGKTFCMSFYYA